MENENVKVDMPDSNPVENATNFDGSAESTLKPLWIGIYLLLISVIITILLYLLWPIVKTDVAGKQSFFPTWYFFCTESYIGDEARLILLVLLSGALGSFIHAATSFVTFTGNRSLGKSWAWWYVLRPFIGGTLALLFYFVIRGGLLSTGTSASGISVFGITGLAGLVGMFSKNAIDKLREVFETLFKTEKGKGDEGRLDKAVKQIMAETVMIPINKISVLSLTGGKTPQDIPLKEIYKMFTGIVTRVPVLGDNNIVKYIIHQSVLYKYIAHESVEAAGAPAVFNIGMKTLNDLLVHPEFGDLVSSSFAFVKRTATLADAKKAMESLKNCQDVFVTATCQPGEPVLGWLTNVEILKSE